MIYLIAGYVVLGVVGTSVILWGQRQEGGVNVEIPPWLGIVVLIAIGAAFGLPWFVWRYVVSPLLDRVMKDQ